MKEVKIRLRKFEELDKAEQEEVIDNNREGVSNDFNADYLIEDYLEAIKTETGLEFEIDDVVWSVGGRDGRLGVTGSSVGYAVRDKLDLVDDVDVPGKVGCFLQHMGGGICKLRHTEYDMATVEFVEDVSTEKKVEIQDKVYELVNKIIDISINYFSKLDGEYSYSYSDAAVKDYLINNDFSFTDSLEIYNE